MRRSALTAARTAFSFLLTAAIISTIAGGAQPAVAGGPHEGDVAERLGTDDGFVLSILYSGDLHGSLETCG